MKPRLSKIVWVLVGIIITLVLVILFTYLYLFIKYKYFENYCDTTKSIQSKELQTLLNYVMINQKTKIIHDIQKWIDHFNNEFQMTKNVKIQGSIHVDDVIFHHCDDKGICPSTSYVCREDNNMVSGILLFVVKISSSSSNLVFVDKYTYPFTIQNCTPVIRFEIRYDCHQNLLTVNSINVVGVNNVGITFENTNWNQMMDLLVIKQPWNFVSVLQTLFDSFQPIQYADFITSKWIKQAMCNGVDFPPIVEWFEPSLVSTGTTIDYKTAFQSGLYEIFVMVVDYFTNTPFTMGTDPCTKIAESCSDDENQSCCSNKNTLQTMFLSCLQGTQINDDKQHVYTSACQISGLDKIQFKEVKDVIVANDRLEIICTFHVPFMVVLYVYLTKDTYNDCDAYLALQFKSCNPRGYIHASCSSEMEMTINVPLSVDGRSTVFHFPMDSIQLKFTKMDDIHLDSAEDTENSKCLLSCINAFYDLKPNKKIDLDTKIYHGVESTLNQFGKKIIKDLFPTGMATFPLYLLPTSIYNQPVEYQNFFNLVASSSHSRDLQTCQNASPSVLLTPSFECQETRKGAGCAIQGGNREDTINPYIVPLRLTEEDPTLLYQSLQMTTQCRSYYDKEYEHTDWNISCGSMPYMENKIQIPPCPTKTLVADMNDNNLINLSCSPTPLNYVQPLFENDLRNAKYIYVDTQFDGYALSASWYNMRFDMTRDSLSVVTFRRPTPPELQYLPFRNCNVPTSVILTTNFTFKSIGFGSYYTFWNRVQVREDSTVGIVPYQRYDKTVDGQVFFILQDIRDPYSPHLFADIRTLSPTSLWLSDSMLENSFHPLKIYNQTLDFNFLAGENKYGGTCNEVKKQIVDVDTIQFTFLCNFGPYWTWNYRSTFTSTMYDSESDQEISFTGSDNTNVYRYKITTSRDDVATFTIKRLEIPETIDSDMALLFYIYPSSDIGPIGTFGGMYIFGL